jgi:disulfide oxidoreductase YuzD
MARRFGDAASIRYHDVTDVEPAADLEPIMSQIRERGLVYPVTVIDGTPIYDGAVSYPAILRAVQQRIETSTPGA